MSGYEIAVVLSAIALVMSSGCWTICLVALLDPNYTGSARSSTEFTIFIASIMGAMSLMFLIICSAAVVMS